MGYGRDHIFKVFFPDARPTKGPMLSLPPGSNPSLPPPADLSPLCLGLRPCDIQLEAYGKLRDWGLLSPPTACGLRVIAASEALCFSSLCLSLVTVPGSCGTGECRVQLTSLE